MATDEAVTAQVTLGNVFRATLIACRGNRGLPVDKRPWSQLPEADRADLEFATEAAIGASPLAGQNVRLAAEAARLRKELGDHEAHVLKVTEDWKRLKAGNDELTRDLADERARYARLHEQFVGYCRGNGLEPPPEPGAVEAAARHFAGTWAELMTTMLPDEHGCTMQCSEAEAAAYLYRVLGEEKTADAIIAAHAAYDEPGEVHSSDPLAGAGEMAAQLDRLGLPGGAQAVAGDDEGIGGIDDYDD